MGWGFRLRAPPMVSWWSQFNIAIRSQTSRQPTPGTVQTGSGEPRSDLRVDAVLRPLAAEYSRYICIGLLDDLHVPFPRRPAHVRREDHVVQREERTTRVVLVLVEHVDLSEDVQTGAADPTLFQRLRQRRLVDPGGAGAAVVVQEENCREVERPPPRDARPLSGPIAG